ncbi:unnamed protein product [Paramecium sonneborni]|uniref:Transmembrane protein n=1 Tax=Paramecium sonneborni TaxID=65129 RepID=A0A8S1LAV5_9CILI|nr:unnamed protein product [Paramecium sonneborni]
MEQKLHYFVKLDDFFFHEYQFMKNKKEKIAAIDYCNQLKNGLMLIVNFLYHFEIILFLNKIRSINKRKFIQKQIRNSQTVSYYAKIITQQKCKQNINHFE